MIIIMREDTLNVIKPLEENNYAGSRIKFFARIDTGIKNRFQKNFLFLNNLRLNRFDAVVKKSIHQNQEEEYSRTKTNSEDTKRSNQARKRTCIKCNICTRVCVGFGESRI